MIDCSKIKHLIVFVHGLTNKCTQHNLCHGLALFQAHEQNKLKYNNQSHMFYSRANLGVTGSDTYTNTSQGIEIAGDRLAQELDTLLRYDFSDTTDLSLIGASLGGLFSRFAIAQLFATKKSVIIEKNINLHAFVTLATPHLGSYNLRKPRPSIPGITNSTRDLHLHNNELENLAKSSSDILGNFTHRVAYAPLINDGIVPWCTSALSLSSLSSRSLFQSSSSVLVPNPNPNPMIREYKSSPSSDKCDWIDETDPNLVKVVQMAKLLQGSPWTIVDVNMPHKHLATLYLTGPQASQSQEVASHVLKWFKINDVKL